MSENRVTSQQKKLVAERAAGCCEYCRSQVRFAIQPFSIEHIIPKSQGGETTLDNLAFSCQGCNNHKYNKIEGYDPTNGDKAVLYHPRQHKWSHHFVWNDDFTILIGLTSIGRATVETLQLNREGVVNLRRVLYATGEHPPAEPS
jgi:HNH endonuclease